MKNTVPTVFVNRWSEDHGTYFQACIPSERRCNVSWEELEKSAELTIAKGMFQDLKSSKDHADWLLTRETTDLHDLRYTADLVKRLGYQTEAAMFLWKGMMKL